MNLASELARQVDASIRLRGMHYYESGAVTLSHFEENRIEAAVRGTHRYEVSLELEPRRGHARILARCSCPYFEGSGICKHIWATILAVDGGRELPGLDELGPLRLVDEELAMEDDEDEDEDDGFDSIADLLWSDDGADSDGQSVDWPRRASRPLDARRGRPPPLDWRDELGAIRRKPSRAPYHGSKHLLDAPSESQVLYVLDTSFPARREGYCVLELFSRTRKQSGDWGEPSRCSVMSYREVGQSDSLDRRILGLLLGVNLVDVSTYSYHERAVGRFVLHPSIHDVLFPLLCETGRFHACRGKPDFEREPLRLDTDCPWELRLKVDEDAAGGGWVLTAHVDRDGEPLKGDFVCVPGGWLFADDGFAVKGDDHDAYEWCKLLDAENALRIPAKDSDAFLEFLYRTPRLPPIDWASSLRPEEIRSAPRFRVSISEDEERGRVGMLQVELSFLYGSVRVPPAGESPFVLERETRKLYVRDVQAEEAAVARLRELGCRIPPAHVYRYYEERRRELELAASRLPEVVRALVADGWIVEAHGRLIRPAGQFRMSVSSGIDWFDLNAEMDFGDDAVKLPELLAAVKRGETWVRLGDGTCGMLPEEWLQRYGFLVRAGEIEEDTIRFRSYQVGLLDALLADQPDASWDEAFARGRAALRRFDGIRPKQPPRGFKGTLRSYQREGLGWLHFLRQFGLGGCLADDMGLGKTVQTLALLEARRLERQRAGGAGKPSLVVVPRSLLFNWIAEAARFAPRLRFLDHTGAGRSRRVDDFQHCDVVLTTYGTLRRDAPILKDVAFDYLILDEAQAIKNFESQSSKAARLLQADHRLALSGTPIENHLGELWSLFEFLNPGMLGASSAFTAFSGREQVDDEIGRQVLGRAIRPFILRRTKNEVAKDLPEKSEQIVFCDLDPRQRKLYEEIRDHYRASLLSRVGRKGLKQSKIHVLEALLRMRQAACHPGLIDERRSNHSSAKLDVLLERVTTIVDQGRKALVFSQFTSLLALVRRNLDKKKITYEYLDGRTRKRAERVERFQSDPDCPLFLISLKAGGLGLNLTAAEYVFLLDPWWNPATEAQAVDRTHRIGQKRPVFSYRLIARDTVEEKVLELQQRKRDLADAIISQNGSLLRDMTRDDLEMLLS